MTVSYTREVATAADKLSFMRVIFRWRGSLWKLVWFELLIWCVLFTAISMLYRYGLSDEQKNDFEWICLHAWKYADYVPLSFLLGAYVTFVVNRWHKQFNAIGWIDKSIMLTSSYIGGSSDRARMLRRGIARHMCLLQVLIFRLICAPVRKRFPTLESLRDAGYLLPDEMPDMTDTKFFQPVKWAMEYVKLAREENMIGSDNAVQDIYEELMKLRVKLLSLFLYDWAPVPLNYTQIVFIAVRMYFIVELLGRQFLDSTKFGNRHSIDCYVPFLSIYQFIVYVGWVKVAEALLNPFGEDDDDFETNWIIDRNFKVGLDIADNAADFAPPLQKDRYWNEPEVVPFYSTETALDPLHGAIGSAVEVTDDDSSYHGSLLSLVSSAIRSISNWSLNEPEARRHSVDQPSSTQFSRERLFEHCNRFRAQQRKFSGIEEVAEEESQDEHTNNATISSPPNPPLRRVQSNTKF